MKQVGLSLLLVMILLTSALFTSVHAGYPIRGFVLDASNGEPLPVANVVVVNLNKGAATNLDGFFIIAGLDPGIYILKAGYLGYRSREVVVTVSTTTMDPLYIELVPESMALKEVVFTAEKEDEEELRLSPRVSTVPVDNQTIRNIPSLGAEMDVMRALQAIPGVKASSELSSALYVRGGSPDMTLIQMDQSTVYNPSHLFGLFSTFNTDAVKFIELMKGGFPARYGGRAGSVLEVITNEGNRKNFEGLASVGLISAHAAFEGPLPKKVGSYAVSGRRTYFDPLLDIMRKNEDFKDLPDYYFYDSNGKINLDLTDRTTLTIGGYLGSDELRSEFGPEDSRLKLSTYWGNRTFTSRMRQVMPKNAFLTLGMAYSRYGSGFYMENEGAKLIDFRNRFHDLAFRLDYEYHGIPNHQMETGLESRRYSSDIDQHSDDAEYVRIKYIASNFSHYIQDRWKISAYWELFPGIRWSYHDRGQTIRFDPRLALLYHYSPQTRIKLAGGRYHQWVSSISFADVAVFLDMWVPNDGTTSPTYTDQIVLGFEHDPRPDLEFTFESYYTWMKNLLEINNSIDRGNSIKEGFIQGNGYAYGFEWMLRQKAGRLTGWLGYSLSWSRRHFPDTYVNRGNWYYPKWDRRHDFIFISTFKLNQCWDLSAGWRYNTGQGYTRAVGIYSQHYAHMENEDFQNHNRFILNGSKNNYRFPADHRLDLTLVYNHRFFKLPAKLNISIYNVYSRRAIWLINYNTSENPVEVSEVKLLPILPLVSYEVRF